MKSKSIIMDDYDAGFNDGINNCREMVIKLERLCDKYEQALNLIAAPPRPDGTYNRCREACQKIAKKALE